MSRRGQAVRHEILPDPIFGKPIITRFINKIMIKGKKATAEKIFYGALDIIKEKVKKEGLEVFEAALRNVIPLMEVKPRRVGGATYQVPVEVKHDRGVSMAMQWIIIAARAKKSKPMIERLSEELLDAYGKVGGAVKKRDETHRMAEANKAFAHFKW